MNMNIDCMLCQNSGLTRHLASLPLDEKVIEQGLKRIFDYYSKCRMDTKPPEVYVTPWEWIVELNGGEDMMLELKRRDNQLVMALVPAMKEDIKASADPFRTAMMYTIAANVIDPLPQHGLSPEQVLKEAVKKDLYTDHSQQLKEEIKQAEHILYLTDNAGEVAADKVFIETLIELGYITPDQLTVATKGICCFNDALYADAEQVGLTDVVRVITTGDNVMGLCFERSSQEFLEAFRQADLIIAKGMGNFESLSRYHDKRIAHLFMTKCKPVAKESNSPIGSFMCLMHGENK